MALSNWPMVGSFVAIGLAGCVAATGLAAAAIAESPQGLYRSVKHVNPFHSGQGILREPLPEIVAERERPKTASNSHLALT